MRIRYAHVAPISRRKPKTSRASRTRQPARRKTPTNLTLRTDLVERAKALGLNLSDVVESSLEAIIAAAEQSRWLAENEEAIDYYNAFVEKHGVFGEEHRKF